MTLPTRKPVKKPASPPKNITLAIKPSQTPPKKPSSPPKNTTLVSPALVVKPTLQTPTKKPGSPPKNTTLAAKPDIAQEGVVSEQSTPIPVITTPTVTSTPTVTNNGRCRCVNGQCGCCTGSVLAAFNQKACLNMTYEPDDFAFTTIMSVNERVVYKNTFSGI